MRFQFEPKAIVNYANDFGHMVNCIFAGPCDQSHPAFVRTGGKRLNFCELSQDRRVLQSLPFVKLILTGSIL